MLVVYPSLGEVIVAKPVESGDVQEPAHPPI